MKLKIIIKKKKQKKLEGTNVWDNNYISDGNLHFTLNVRREANKKNRLLYKKKKKS